eukprot:m.54137 g.54137  ORF g.54137 m.54137 type:complete len:63 (-) comp48695_c0_seq2:660-848(-)
MEERRNRPTTRPIVDDLLNRLGFGFSGPARKMVRKQTDQARALERSRLDSGLAVRDQSRLSP